MVRLVRFFFWNSLILSLATEVQLLGQRYWVMGGMGSVITLPRQTCIVFSLREIFDLSSIHISLGLWSASYLVKQLYPGSEKPSWPWCCCSSTQFLLCAVCWNAVSHLLSLGVPLTGRKEKMLQLKQSRRNRNTRAEAQFGQLLNKYLMIPFLTSSAQ